MPSCQRILHSDALAVEDIQFASVDVLLQELLNLQRKRPLPPAHVRVPEREPNLAAGRDRDH